MNIAAIFELELLSLSNLDRIQSCLYSLMKDDLFSFFSLFPHRHNVTWLSLLYCYFHDKCSYEIHSLVSPVQTFISKICYAMYVEMNHTHSLHIPNVMKMFYSNNFPPQETTALWNRLSHGWFSKCYNFNILKSTVNHYLSSKLS